MECISKLYVIVFITQGHEDDIASLNMMLLL